MAGLTKIQKDLEIIKSIESLAVSYEEIATLEMKKIKKNVLETRKFLDGVAEIYNHAKSAYISQFFTKSEKERQLIIKQFPFIRRNGREIVVFLSANERFYGGLILDIFKALIKTLNKDCDLAVVGEIGKHLIRQIQPPNKTFFFDLKDDYPDENQIKTIFDTISQYERIVVWHGKFETVAIQKPTKTDISGGITFKENVKQATQYLFEPSPEAIMEFFEKEIINALFHQTIFEHQLAKYASRMIAMHQAKENARALIKKLDRKIYTIRKQLEDKKQLNSILSFRLWEKI